jgi:hypothetical protein
MVNLKIEYTEKDIKDLLELGSSEVDIDDPCCILTCDICPVKQADKCDPVKLYNMIITEGITIELKRKG